MLVRRWISVTVATIASLGAALAVPQAAVAAPVPAGFSVAGIDVSSHDHAFPLDWTAVAASGVRFAYVKATEGTGYVNPYFAGDYAAAKAAGLATGAYVFARPDLGDPAGQADFFLAHLTWANDAHTLVPFVDLEWPYSGLGVNACWNLTPVALTTWIHAFLNRIQAGIGRPPMIYTNTNWWNPCTGNDATFGGYPLDIAGYRSTPPPLPAGWQSFAVWQYAAGDTSVAGVYDSDVASGAATVQALAGPWQSAGPVLAPPARVSLKARSDNRFVAAERAGRAALAATRGTTGSWEHFTLYDLGGGYVALRAAVNGRFVTAENGGRSPLVANRGSVGAWESFRLVRNANGTVSLLAVNHRYVTAAAGNRYTLLANAAGIGTAQSFTLVG